MFRHFVCIYSRDRLNILWQKENLLIMSIFYFCRNVYQAIKKNPLFNLRYFRKCLLHTFYMPVLKKRIVLQFYLRRAGGFQYVVSSITLEAFVQSSPNQVRMCIGIISRTSSIASHIALVNQELSPFNYRNYPKLVLSAQ